MLSLVIEQQHERFEKLKATFDFESVSLGHGVVLRHPLLSREERDHTHRKLPNRRR